MSSSPRYPPDADQSSIGLKLDPGPPRRRNPKISCQCISWTLLFLIFLGGVYIAVKIFYVIFLSFRAPHADMYQDEKKSYKPQDVVVPLVDGEQSFDVVATVWLKSDLEEPSSGDKDDEGAGLVERVLFSDTIFNGLKIKGRDSKTSVNFRVPTEIFKGKIIREYDLRASFVLVPSTPSLLDRVANYSKWIPSSVEYPPTRSWPDGYSRTLAEEVIDAYGIITPLLSFHEVKSRCKDNSTETITSEDEFEEDEEDDSLFNNTVVRFSKKGKAARKHHPFIITRTYLNVIDMTKLYNRKAYDKAHKELKGFACRQNDVLSWRLCHRSFMVHGNSEVRIKLKKDESDSSAKSKWYWAYAPYLSASENAYGPRDLVVVPINREECSKQGTFDDPLAVPDENFVDVNWKIAFASRTPEKFLYFDVYSSHSRSSFDMMASEDKILADHSNVEFNQGIGGHHFRENYSPRLVVLFSAISYLLLFIVELIGVHYWYSLTSTVGISITGTNLLASSAFLQFLFSVVVKIDDKKYGTWQSIWAFLSSLPWQMQTLTMLKATTRAEFYWWKGWIPGIHFAPATHAERANERLENRTSYKVKILAFFGLAALFYVFSPLNYHIVPRRGPSIDDDLRRAQVFNRNIQRYAVFPAQILGIVLQIVLNYRSRSFAGMYKLAALLIFISGICDLAGASPKIIGDPGEVHAGFGLLPFINVLLNGVFNFQAYKYPSVKQGDEDEDGK